MPAETATSQVNRLAENPDALDSSGLDAADLAMLRYVIKLTRDPAEMNEDDVQSLRNAGFEDVAIHDICNIAAYFAYVNRVADGLGVDLEN